MEYYDQDFDIEEFLEKTQQREENRLEKELERIEEQLEERDRVHEEVIDELESKLDWYIDRLEALYSQMRGKSGERERLKGKISSFYTQIRDEKRSHWQDKQELEKDRRRLLRELNEISDSTVSDIF